MQRAPFHGRSNGAGSSGAKDRSTRSQPLAWLQLWALRYLPREGVVLGLIALIVVAVTIVVVSSSLPGESSGLRGDASWDLPSPLPLAPGSPHNFTYPVGYEEMRACQERTDMYADQLLREASERRACVLVQSLGGSTWWRYVSQEFAEVLASLAARGMARTGATDYHVYRPLPNPRKDQSVPDWLSGACRGELPGAVVLWEVEPGLLDTVGGWAEIQKHVPVLLFLDDLQWRNSEEYRRVKSDAISAADEVFSTYAYNVRSPFPDTDPARITWVPHSAGEPFTRVPVPEVADQRNAVFVSGANSGAWYPCRARAFEMCGDERFSCLQHPGYALVTAEHKHSGHAGMGYATNIASHRFALATCTSVSYVLGKMLEVPASGAALTTTEDMVAPMQALGFPRDAFFVVDCSSNSALRESVAALTELPVEKVARARSLGLEVARSLHTTAARASQLHVRILLHALGHVNDPRYAGVGRCFNWGAVEREVQWP